MPSRDNPSTYVYVDGAYVREELRRSNRSDEFDPRKPAEVLRHRDIVLGVVQPVLIPSRYFYYDALDVDAPEEQRDKQESYFNKLRGLPDTHVVLGEVRKTRKKNREQKGVDVQLAVDALQAASRGAVSTICLVTGDADFVPLVKAIRDIGPHVRVIAFKSSLSTALANEADRVHHLDSVPNDWELSASD